eukprot:865080-Amphidinium_carterae.1
MALGLKLDKQPTLSRPINGRQGMRVWIDWSWHNGSESALLSRKLDAGPHQQHERNHVRRPTSSQISDC